VGPTVPNTISLLGWRRFYTDNRAVLSAETAAANTHGYFAAFLEYSSKLAGRAAPLRGIMEAYISPTQRLLHFTHGLATPDFMIVYATAAVIVLIFLQDNCPIKVSAFFFTPGQIVSFLRYLFKYLFSTSVALLQ